jgi:HEAT repeat protein/beta-lactamase regulating signal transducer with metallopeptidase domain
MDAFFSFAALAVIKATLLLGGAGVFSLLLRRRSAALRHLVWSLAIAGVVVLPFAMASSPVTLHLLPAAETLATDLRAEPHAAEPSTAIGDALIEQASSNMAAPAGFTQPTGITDITPTGWSFDARTFVALWLLGALALLVRFVGGMLRLRGIVRRAAPIDVDDWIGAPRSDTVRPTLRMSAEVDMPFASGLFHPTIVLPASSSDWSPQRRVAVLQHELAHLSRGDLLMNAISHLARALHWFNPLAWYAAHRVRIESERACDDAVLRKGARASDYAEHLLSIAGSGAAAVPAAALAMARPSAFEGRLLAILEPDLERSALSRLKLAGAVILFLVVILPLAAASPTAKVEAMTPNLPETIFVQDPMPDTQLTARAPQTGRNVIEGESVVPALVDALSDANGAVRLAAVKSLGELQDPRAIAALGKALREDADPRVRRAAAEALGEIDDNRAVPHLVAALRSERIADVREAIVGSLGEIDDPSAVAAVAAVVRDSSVGVRRAAASALNEFEDPSALPALLSMVRDTDAEVRREVAQGLSDLESTQTFDALTALSRDSDAEVRAAAVNGLGNLEDARTLPALLAALRDSNAEVRSQAADAIHNIPDLDKAPPQLIALLTDSDADVRHNVAHALGSFEDEAAVPALKRALSDTNADVRRAVAEALSDIGGAEAITALMGLLKDPDPEIRRIAAEALGKRRE